MQRREAQRAIDTVQSQDSCVCLTEEHELLCRFSTIHESFLGQKQHGHVREWQKSLSLRSQSLLGKLSFLCPLLPRLGHMEVHDPRKGQPTFLSLVILLGLHCILKGEHRGRWSAYQYVECTPVVSHQVHFSHAPGDSELGKGCILFCRLIDRGTNTWGSGYVLFYGVMKQGILN